MMTENGSTSKAFIHFMGGPKNGTSIEINAKDFDKHLPMTYRLIDAYVKNDVEHYEVGYTGSLSWPDQTT